MRRLLFAVATALGGAVGVAFLATGPAMAHADDTPTTCASAKKTIETGAKDILTDLRQAQSQAAQGNNAGADATVKATGPKFSAIGTSLQRVANSASDQNLKSALTGLGTEFGRVGSSVTDLNSLKNFDDRQLNAQGQRVAKICGFSASPGPSNSPPPHGPSAATTA